MTTGKYRKKFHGWQLKKVQLHLGMALNTEMVMLASEIMRRTGQGIFCPDKATARDVIWRFLPTIPRADPVQQKPSARAVQTQSKWLTWEPKRPAQTTPATKSLTVCEIATGKPAPEILSQKFYNSEEWRRVRYLALRASRGVCELCGVGPTHGHPLHVDHIKPRSKHPELALEISNLQVLCEDCNLGKSNIDEIDWRKSKPSAAS